MIIRIDTAGVESFYQSSMSIARELHRLADASRLLAPGVEALRRAWATYEPGRTPSPDAVDAVNAAGRCTATVANHLDRSNHILLAHIGGAGVIHADWGLSDLSLAGLRRSLQASVLNGIGTFGSGIAFGAGRSSRRAQLMRERYQSLFARDTLLPSWLTLGGVLGKGLGIAGLAENTNVPRRFDGIEDSIESTLRRAGIGPGYERAEDLGEASLPWLKRVSVGFNFYSGLTDDVPNYLDARARFNDPTAARDERLMAGADIAFDDFRFVEHVPTPLTFAIGRAGTASMATGEALYDGFTSRADDEIDNAEADAFRGLHAKLEGATFISRYDSLVDENRLRTDRSQL